MIKPLLLALTLQLASSFVAVAHAGEITLLPSIKLQIGDQDRRGNYWDGGRWLNSNDWHRHYRWHDNRWHRYTRGPVRHNSYAKGYRDGFKDSRREHHGPGHHGHGPHGHGPHGH